MSELKTKPTSQSIAEYMDTIEPPEKRRDGFALLEMFQKITGEKAVMWGSSIVGFGSYHYKSERSKQASAYYTDRKIVSLYEGNEQMSGCAVQVCGGSPQPRHKIAPKFQSRGYLFKAKQPPCTRPYE